MTVSKNLSREAAASVLAQNDPLEVPVAPPAPHISYVLDDAGTPAYQGIVQLNGYTDDTTPTLIGNGAAAGDLIKVYHGDRVIGSTIVQGNGSWRFTPSEELREEGVQVLRATATDSSNGLESDFSPPFSFILDLTPPSAQATIQNVSEALPEQPLVTVDSTPMLFGSLSTALAANEKLQISLDTGATWQDVASVSGAYWQYQDVRELQNGNYTYLLRTIDAAGNQGAMTAQQITISREVTPQPVEGIKVSIIGITPDTGVEGDYITSASKITLLGTLSEELPAGAKLQVSVDGGNSWKTVQAFGTDWIYIDPSVHNLGTQVRYEMRVLDAQGNPVASSYAAQDVVFDAGNPLPDMYSSIELGTDTAVEIAGQYSNAQSAQNNDFITRDNSVTLSGKLSAVLQIGQHLQLSLDGGKTWETLISNGGQLWSYTSEPLSASQQLGVKLRVADNAGNSVELGERTLVVDIDSPVPFAFAPQLGAQALSGERAYYSSAQYGLAEAGATVALVQDVNRDGRYQEGLDKIVGYAVAGNDGRWSFDAILPEGQQQLGFVTWDVAGNNSGFGPQVLTDAHRPVNEAGFSVHDTGWGGTVASVRGSNTAAMAMSADGTWSFFQSTGYALSSTAYKNAGHVFSGLDRDEYRASYLSEPLKVTSDGNGHMISKATFADYNRDGLMDVIANVSGNSADLPVWTAKADGTYSAGSVNNPNRLNIGGVIAWDGNGDGYTDFIVVDNTIGSWGFNLIRNDNGVLKGERKGNTWWGSEISGVDLNNDGAVDLAGHNDQHGNTALGVLLTQSDGSWSKEQTFGRMFRSDSAGSTEYSNLATSMTWADFDGDGDLDLFLARGARSSTGHNGNSDDSRIYLNKGTDANGKWLGMDNDNPLFFNDALGQDQKGNLVHFDGGPSFAVDWNHDGKMDVIEAPRQNAAWSSTNAAMTPVLFINQGNGDWMNSGQLLGNEAYDNVTGAVAVDYDFDGAVDLLLYRTSGKDHVGLDTASSPTVLIRNENHVAEGTSLILRILDKNGMNSYFGNTVQLFDAAGRLVASQILNPQSGVTNDSSGLVYFYGLDANQTYSAKLLAEPAIGNGNMVPGRFEEDLGLINPTWGNLVTGAAEHAYVLTAGKPTVSFDSQGAGTVGTGYNDSFMATEGNDVINGGGGWNLLADGSKQWSATQGLDEVDYQFAKQGVQVNLQSGQSLGMGNDTLIGIEAVKGSWYADAFMDNAASNRFEGRGGDDVYYLFGGGNDTLAYRPVDAWDVSADGSNGHDMVFGFGLGNVLNNSNADIIDLRGMLGYGGPVSLVRDDGVLQLDASSQGLLDYLSSRVEGNNTIISVDRDGIGQQVGSTDLITLMGVRTDLLNLIQNHQIMV